ncbi:hypothetical protein F5887DRAFT_981015 [Amanita rubescens]|nr:hypothetical protein F5887DRAFT_981015 [Amanita rubescens]
MHYVSSSWLVLAILPAVLAQSENANCTDLPTYGWLIHAMQTVRRHSDSYIDRQVKQMVNRPGFTLPPITPNGSYNGPYNGPTVDQSNKKCYCTSIFYSLISACAACQFGTWITWPDYHQNCSTAIYLTVYPDTIPSDTVVPRWAFLDVTATNNTFDPAAASRAAATSATAGSKSHSSKLSAGGIAGTVVGSVLGALLIAALLGTGINAIPDAGNTESMNQPTRASPLSLPTVSSPPLSSPGTSPPPLSEHQPLKYYNPDDPTTHPDAIFGQIGSSPDQPQGYAGYAEPT